MGLFSSHSTPDIVPEISIKFSKEKYIFGVDTHIEGMLDMPEGYSISGDMKIGIRYSIFDSYNDTIVNWDNIDTADLSDISDVDDNLIESITITDPKKSFSFLIKSPNFYGDIGVPVDSEYFSCIINYITVSIKTLEFSRCIPVCIEYPSLDALQLMDLNQRDNIDEDDFDDMEEPIFNEYLGIKKLPYKKLIPLELYNDIASITNHQKIGKYFNDIQIVNEVAIILIVFFIPYGIINMPYYINFFLLDSVSLFFNSTKHIIDFLYFIFTILCIYIQLFCVNNFKKYIESKSWWMNMYNHEDIEDSDESNEVILFKKQQFSLSQLVANHTKNPGFLLSITGTVQVGLKLYHYIDIDKHESHRQIFIDKKFAEYRFSSLATLLDHQIDLPDWVREMVSIDDEEGNLYCDIIIFIQYDGLMNQYREINLY